jgi:hypothetical protein
MPDVLLVQVVTQNGATNAARDRSYRTADNRMTKHRATGSTRNRSHSTVAAAARVRRATMHVMMTGLRRR